MIHLFFNFKTIIKFSLFFNNSGTIGGADDGMRMTNIMYANGPGFKDNHSGGKRKDPSKMRTGKITINDLIFI